MPTLAELLQGMNGYQPRRGTLGMLQQQQVAARPEPQGVLGMGLADALARSLKEPLPMEGRANFLPFQDTNKGRQVALPGVLAGAFNAITAPARSANGGWVADEDGNIKPAFNAQDEAQNVAMNMLGLGAGIPSQGGLAMGMRGKPSTVKIQSWPDFQKNNAGKMNAMDMYESWRKAQTSAVLVEAERLASILNQNGIRPIFGGGLLEQKRPSVYENGIGGISSYMQVPGYGEVRLSDHMRSSGLGNDRTFGNADDAAHAIRQYITKNSEIKNAKNAEFAKWRDAVGLTPDMDRATVISLIKDYISKNPQSGQAKDFGWWKDNRLGLGHDWSFGELKAGYNPFK